MIHGIYIKSRPKSTWYLMSVALSAEAAQNDVLKLKEQAISEGNESAQIAVQVFESSFYIPEILYDIKEQKPSFN